MTPSQNIIIKVKTPPKIGEKVVDEELKQVGTVSDVFGPVSSPYVTVKAAVENPKLLVSQILYAIPSSRQTARRKENRE